MTHAIHDAVPGHGTSPRTEGVVAGSLRPWLGSFAAEHAAAFAVFCATMMGLVLRVPRYLSPSLYVDEGNTAWAVRWASISDYVTWQHHLEHPPLSYMLIEAVMWITRSDGMWVLRLPAFVSGVLCIPLAYVLGRMLGGKWLGVLAAAFIALDPNMVQQSGLARMYTPFMLLLLIILITLTAALSRRGVTLWVACGFLLAAAIWTNTLGLAVTVGLIAGTMVAACLPLRWRHISAPMLLGGMTLMLTLALAWSHIGIFVRLTTVSEIVGGDAGVVHRAMFMFHSMGQLGGGAWAWPFTFLAAAAGLVLLARKQPVMVILLVAMAMANLLFIYLLLRSFHSADARHFSAMQPALWIGWAALVASLFTHPGLTRWGGVGVVVAVLIMQLWWSTHLMQWYPRPASFTVSLAVQKIQQAEISPQDVIYLPAWCYSIPEYHKMPLNWPLHEWAWAVSANQEPAEQTTPVIPTRMHIVAGLPNDDSIEQARRLVSALAVLYELTPEAATIPDPQPDAPVMLITMDRLGVNVEHVTAPR